MGKDVTVYPGAFVGDGARIGDRVTLFPGVVLYEGVELGNDVTLHANVSVRERCRIGNRVIVHCGSVIGSDGFGYAPEGSGWYKIPQLGIVVIEDDVEIGANTTIDRAALDVTLIKRGTKIDNLVQIAHNCVIGENCMIASQVGGLRQLPAWRSCDPGGSGGCRRPSEDWRQRDGRGQIGGNGQPPRRFARQRHTGIPPPRLAQSVSYHSPLAGTEEDRERTGEEGPGTGRKARREMNVNCRSEEALPLRNIQCDKGA